MTRRWKASRLIYRVDKLWGGHNSSRRLSERLSERLERTATPRGEGNARGSRSDIVQGLSDPALRIKGDDDDDDGMECAWRGSSGRSSSPVGGGEGSRSRRHCADSVLLALLGGDEQRRATEKQSEWRTFC